MTAGGTSRIIPLAELPTLVGEELGTSGWHTLTQRQIDLFAEATGDRAWIHVDPERAKSGPYGATIAHGFLTVSLVPVLTAEAFTVTGGALMVNYGINRVRFPAPLLVDSRIRLKTTLNDLQDNAADVRLTLGFEIEAEGKQRPVAIGETILLIVKSRQP